jgi:hypothetical protein
LIFKQIKNINYQNRKYPNSTVAYFLKPIQFDQRLTFVKNMTIIWQIHLYGKKYGKTQKI